MGYSIDGLDDILNKLNQIGSVFPEQAALEMKAAAQELNTLILQNIRSEKLIGVSGDLMKKQVVENVDNQTTLVVNRAYYAAYQEFGTGAQVNVPAEFSEAALSAKYQPKRGDFQTFVRLLEEWARIKGITPIGGTKPSNYKQMAYLMAVSILKNGLKPRPFFFKAYVQIRPKILNTMQNLLKLATK